MLRLSGWLYRGGRFREGSVSIEGDVITDVSAQKARDPIATGLILPSFANAHTHAGDAVVRDEVVGTIEELVAPPKGLKHRVLARASDEDVIAAMRTYFETMVRTGTVSFWDFREMGLRGVRQLFAAALGFPIRPIVFGRPAGMTYDPRETRALLRSCDGLAISSLLDWDPAEAAKLAKAAHDAGKRFALHASERVHEDIDSVLDLKPDLLVHLTEATNADLTRVAEAGVPVAVCPRSNAFFGKIIDLPKMIRAGLRLHLGTDNAMINAPSMLREMEFAWKISHLRGGVEPRAILDMALRGGRGLDASFDAAVRPGDAADLVVLDVPRGRPTFTNVFRSVETNIVLVSAGGRTWLRGHGGLVEQPPGAPPGSATRSLPRGKSRKPPRRTTT